MEKKYTHRTLVQKLGITSGMRVLLVKEPEQYQQLLHDIPANAHLETVSFEEVPSLQNEFDFIQVFTQSQERLQELFPHIKKLLKKKGMLWISWPKGHCDIRSNLNENIVREIGLSHSVVDVKVVSIDGNWSSLKFVYRLKDRG